ncbi:MAG TPA: amidase, partial [Streptosporangiaceae bacterium]|nr:amidase [Streptosporangiaceae bacterium]
MRPADLAFRSIGELGALLRSGEVTSAGLTDYFLGRLETVGRPLNAVSAIMADSARQEAALADAQLARGLDRGPLHGIPYGLKDIIAVPGAPTTWGAVPFSGQVLNYEAAVGERLRNAGAVLLGKLATVELAGGMGYADPDASLTGPALNPWDTRTWTGITGLRATHGRVSRHGAMALSWSFDRLGPMCRSAADCGLVL